MDKKSVFEYKPCGRCGGSGRYSYCQMYGDRCFGCAGRGWVLTKRGAAAARFFREKMMVPMEDVKPGDVVEYEDFFRNSRYFVKVEAVYSCLLNKGMRVFEFSRKGNGNGSLGLYPGGKFRKAHSAEEKAAYLKEALEYEASLLKNGKPSLKKAVAKAKEASA